jgi:hypothetical protein
MSSPLSPDVGRMLLGVCCLCSALTVATFTEPQGVWLFVTVVGVSVAVFGGVFMMLVPADPDSK